MRIPEWPLCRMFSPISSAVICSRMRAFSSLPPSIARTPGIFAASSRTTSVGVGIVAADDHIAIDRAFGVQQFRPKILKGRYD